ncbi:hypothetical protein Tco_0441876, partial [Tanacetum coccineum]
RDTKIPQSSGPPVKVGDKAVHKELGDRMKKAATTASSLEAEQDSDAQTSTNEDGVRGITATIDRKVKVFVFEASIRRHLKLEDSEGLKTLPTAEIFEQLALMGFIQIFLNKRKRMLLPHKRTFPTPSLTQKLFSNMKRASKGYSGVDISSFPTMLNTPESSPSRITSSQSLSPQTYPSTSQPPSTPSSNQTTHVTEESALMPHESPLQSVHSLGRDEGSLSLNELMDLCTLLSKKGRSLIEELDLDAGISLVPPHAADQGRFDETQISDQPEEQLGVFSAATALTDAARRRKSNYARQLDKREEVTAKVDEAHDINWSDPAILRYHTLQNRPFSVAEVRKNMCLYLKNQGGYKMSHFKGMSYEDIRPIFERVWDQNQAFIPMGSKIEKKVMKRSGFDLQQESSKLVEEEIVQQDDVIAEQAVKESSRTAGGRRKKSLARKRARETLSEESAKKQKLEDDTEKEELQVYLNIVPEEESLNIESLATKYLIVDWETQILANDKYYYQIKRADGSVKHYKIFSAMLYDFDRQDVLELYRLVKERFQTASPEGYDLLLWGDLKTMIEPNEKDEIWRNKQDWNLINWKLHNFCGVHVLLMDIGFVIHMMVEKEISSVTRYSFKNVE